MICTLFNEKMLNCCEIIMKDCDAELLKKILIYYIGFWCMYCVQSFKVVLAKHLEIENHILILNYNVLYVINARIGFGCCEDCCLKNKNNDY